MRVITIPIPDGETPATVLAKLNPLGSLEGFMRLVWAKLVSRRDETGIDCQDVTMGYQVPADDGSVLINQGLGEGSVPGQYTLRLFRWDKDAGRQTGGVLAECDESRMVSEFGVSNGTVRYWAPQDAEENAERIAEMLIASVADTDA